MGARERAIKQLSDEIRALAASDLGQAMQAAKRAAKTWPGSSVLQSMKAEIYFLRDNFEAAGQALEVGRRCTPMDMKAQMRLARVAAGLGRYQTAHALAVAALAEQPAPERVTRLAEVLIEIGDYQGAVDALAEGEPAEHLEAFRALARRLLEADRRQGVDPQGKLIWLKAMDQLRRGLPERAEAGLADVVRRAPAFAPGWIGLRGALEVQGRAEAAAALAAAWAEAAPGCGVIAAGMARRLSPRGLLFDPRQPAPRRPMAEALVQVESPLALAAAREDAWLQLDPGGALFRHAPAFAFDRLHPEPIVLDCIAPPAFVATLQGALLVGRGVPVTAEGALVEELTYPGLDKSEAAGVEDAVLFDRGRFQDGLRPIRCFDEAAFLLAGPTDLSFGDWMINFPPRLAMAEAAGFDGRIVITDQPLAIAEPMLAALGVDPARLVRHDPSGVSLFPRLYAPSWPMRERLSHIPDPFAIYRRAARPVPAERPRLYLSREGVGKRPMLNEPEVRALFERHGFRAVRPERLGFEEMLELFAGPACVAGPYGSALLNLAFTSARPPCLVIAAPEPELYLREAISWLGAMALPFGYVRGEAAPGAGDGGGGWIAPLDLVEQGLEALLDLETG